MGFYLWKPNPDRLVGERERERKLSNPPYTHTPIHTLGHTYTSRPEAADTVVGLVHDLDVNGPVATRAVIE